MAILTARRKKFFSLAAVCLLGTTPLYADDATAAAPAASGTSTSSSSGASGDIVAILQQIAQYTNSILTAVTTTSNPVVQALVTALANITAADNATDPATPTPNLQNGFTSYVAGAAASAASQLTLEQSLNTDFFGPSVTTTTLMNANDLTFSTLLGQPYFSPDPRTGGSTPVVPSYNYLKNAAGLNLTHVLPGTNWKGAPADQTRYANYYNAISAVQTMNGYILGQLYSDLGNNLTALQTSLVNQASDPKNWFAIIANESIGAVLRQTLMYQSQSYILQTQLLQTQKLMLAAIAANNTLLMLSNATNETLIIRKAIVQSAGG